MSTFAQPTRVPCPYTCAAVGIGASLTKVLMLQGAQAGSHHAFVLFLWHGSVNCDGFTLVTRLGTQQSNATAMTNYNKWDKFAADLASDTESEEEASRKQTSD
eukprot:6331315-Amphidinium_carterae.1